MEDLDTAWEQFCDGTSGITSNCPVLNSSITSEKDGHNEIREGGQEDVGTDSIYVSTKSKSHSGPVPVSSDIYISTKTKISYLNQEISLTSVFWNIPVMPYHKPTEGVVKKQMKFNSTSSKDLEDMQKLLVGQPNVDEHIITRIVNPEGRIKFKDVRKISIGLSKKDIVSYRRKKRGAFYNCFVIMIRIKHNDIFKEIHVKVFNTGKLEIPGIQDAYTLDRVLTLVTEILGPYVVSKVPLSCLRDKTMTVLINSNFNCGYYIDRDKLYNKLRFDYGINSSYDPCSYPGIQCEFYHNNELSIQTGKQNKIDYNKTNNNESSSHIVKVSFMVFRTGSVLIVGMCSEEILDDIYNFLKDLLYREYHNIVCSNTEKKDEMKKQRKIRRKMLVLG